MADLGISPIAAETATLVVARILLFYFCRTFLLRSLYQDLRHLQNAPPTISLHEPPMELGTPTTPHAMSPPLSPDPRLRQTSFTILESSLHDSVENQSLPLPTTAPRQTITRFLKWPSFRRGPSKTLPATHGEGSLQSTLARTAFAICFSESCILFLLVMCQALRIFGPGTRSLNWNISLSLLVGLILLVIPLLQCIFITYRPIQNSPTSPNSGRLSRRLIRRIALTLIPYSLYLVGVHRIPVPEALSDAGLTTRSLSRLAVVGVLILGLISGYGSISTAWTFFQDMAVVKSAGSSLVRIRGPGSALEPTSGEIASAELSLARIRSDLLARRQEVDRRSALSSTDAGASGSGGWVTKLFSKNGDGALPGIQREIAGLEALEIEMAKDLQEIKTRKARIKYSKTFKGRVWRSIGWVFGLYCALRILSSMFNLIFPSARRSGSSSPPDFLTTLVVHLLSLLPVESLHLSHEQVIALARQGSLVMVGGMVLVSVRGILRGISKVLRFTTGVGKSNSGAHSPSGAISSAPGMSSRRSLVANFMLLVLAQVMGVYLLSTLIQLRLSFPPSATTHPTQGSQTVSSETSLFSSLPSYEVFNSLFDWSFLISASLTAFGRWIGGKVGL